ncbi:MAG: alpha/beta hydrolase [Salinibacterium sp.]|nr:alpha/beta hydrolase [Salinibacterium sp.]MBF0671759.1 alpha/beta hydrolase [Salinibacterium sp.]
MTTTISTQRLVRPSQGAIAYDVQGEGPLLLLVPGMGELRSTYRHIVPALVAAGFTVATTDLRGHGDSDTGFDSYGDEATADDITALLRELGRPAIIVGNSMAAGSAVIVAAEHPELVSGLVLVGPFVRDTGGAVSRIAFRMLTAPLWVAAVWKGYMPTLYAGAKPADFDEYRERAIASMRRRDYARAFSKTTRTSHAPAKASLPAVTAPTLVVMGEKDPDFKDPHAEARWAADALRGELVMVPDAGHYPQAQQPQVTAAAIVEFARGVSARG